MTGILNLLAGSISSAIKDGYFNLVTLLLPGNGTNGAQNNTFLDSSSNNFTITRNGNTTQGTFTPFSQTGWGNYFNGTSDYLSVANQTALQMSTGDFTVEFWFYPTNVNSTNQRLVSTTAGSIGSTDLLIRLESTNSIRCIVGSTSIDPGTPTVTGNTWHHLALVRSGSGTNNCSVYLDGTRIAQGTSTSNISTGIQLFGGYYSTGPAEYFYGYMSNVRILKGTAQYSGATITVPTSPLTAITNTSLLTCQSNRFIDNSSNAFAITANGSPSVQAFSPFAPTAAYSAATNGGSGYFDGSGDYLQVSNNTAFDITASDFCVEMWIYRTASGSTQMLFSYRFTSGVDNGWEWRINSTNTMQFYYVGGSSLTTTATVPVNTWTHLAVTRSGTTIRAFINGNLDSSATFSNSTVGSANFRISASNDGTGQITGYVSSARLVKGSAVYTASFTPPTAPLTAITNTSLLCLFTNAGITDATAKNDLETVGNAQISTTQSKFGGGSMYFDGTGDWLVIPDSPNLRLSNGEKFTIEGWIYLTSINVAQGIIVKRAGSATQEWGVLVSSGNKLQFGSNTTNYTANTSLSANTWYYFAVTCDGTNINIYLNGASDFTPAAVSGIVNSTNAVLVGAQTTSANPFFGYIDDLRVTKGYARTISASPTAAFPVQ